MSFTAITYFDQACHHVFVNRLLHNSKITPAYEAMNTPQTHQEKSIPMIAPGRYRHYKGKDYQVIGVAKHSETEEDLVVYRALYGAYGLWVRPVEMFCEKINTGGKLVSRFEWIDEDNLDPSAPPKEHTGD
jgi:hypothetical protein